MKISIYVSLLVSLLLIFCGLMFGCGSGAVFSCHTIYDECEDNISQDQNDFVDDCVEEYFDDDEKCRDAVRDYAQCVAEDGCNDSNCKEDYKEIGRDCGVGAIDIAY